MILLKFNWSSKASLPDGGRFNFGDTYKVAEMVLSKGKSTKACTMEGKESNMLSFAVEGTRGLPR